MMKNSFQLICSILISILAIFIVAGCGGGGGGSDSAAVESGGNMNVSGTTLYTVSGTTTGLIGNGLTLQNNGADDLFISENGFFTFSDQVQDKAQCNVTVLSQPTNPQQVCEVINGSQAISGNDIDDIQIVCFSAFNDSFDSQIDEVNWHTSGGHSQALVNGALEYRLSANGRFNSSYTSFTDTNCGSVSMNVTITETFSDSNDSVSGVRLESCGYHSAAQGEALDNKTGDVFAAIVLRGTQSPYQAYYYVYKCLDNACNSRDNITLLSAEDINANWLGEVALNQPTNLMIDWDGINPKQFSFQVGGGPFTIFDPVAAGASLDGDSPNSPRKQFGINISIDDSDSSGRITALFDNAMVDGNPYDDFNTGTYPNAALWSKTYEGLSIDNGALVIASGREFSGDVAADGKTNVVAIDSHDDLIPNGEIVSCDIAMDSGTEIVDIGGNSAGGEAMIEIRFNPSGKNESDTDLTNVFAIQVGLQQDLTGLSARARSIGCADSTCSNRYTDEIHPFTTLVANDVSYRFTIERFENDIVEIAINDSETLTFNLSAFPEFAATQFRKIKLMTTSKGTDLSGERVLVLGRFDNVIMGEPF